jgi:hypothetical protein
VRLWFAPSSWRWGLILFGVGMMALMVMVVINVGKRRVKRQREKGVKP